MIAGMRFLVLLAALASPAAAEVIRSGEGSFVVEQRAEVAAPPARLWATLIEPARWWTPAHSFSGDAANLTIEPRAGGCFCERLPGGGSVEHARVIHAGPGFLLRRLCGVGLL